MVNRRLLIPLLVLFLMQTYAAPQASSDSTTTAKVENKTETEVVAPRKPEGYLIQPVSRKGTPMNVGTNSPCSDIPKGNAHAIYAPGSLTRVAWKIENQALDSNCSIYLFEGIGYYIPLKENFECGRVTGVEFIFINLPANMTCDHCELQWVWNTYQGSLYQCVDIMILDMASSCLGKCQNGGVCLDGICLCPEGYYGIYCQTTKEQKIEEGPGAGYFIIFMIMIILIVLLCGCLFFIKNPEKIPPGLQKKVLGTCPWILANHHIQEDQHEAEEQYDPQKGIRGDESKYQNAPNFVSQQGGEQGGNPFDDPGVY